MNANTTKKTPEIVQLPDWTACARRSKRYCLYSGLLGSSLHPIFSNSFSWV